MKSYLVAAIAVTMIAGIALARSPSLTTAASGSGFGDITNEASLQPIDKGIGMVGPFWLTLNAASPTRNDDVPKTINYARPLSKTASR